MSMRDARRLKHLTTILGGLAPAALAAAVVLAYAPTAHADWLADLTRPFETALSEGNWAVALGLVFLGGLLTSLTPCVYPMIAITVSVFGASQAKSKLHAAGLSTMYVLGLITLIVAIGMPFALFKIDNSALYGNAWFWVGMSVVLLALSLAMFGVYELRLPSSVQNKLAQMGGVGFRGAFVLGMVGGLIATPCTGPILGGLLVWIGTTGSLAFGAIALATFGAGLGLLTWLVGTFAIGLPKSGAWMEKIKSFFGLVLVVPALFFLVNNALDLGHVLVHKTAIYLGLGIVLVIAGLGMGAIHLSTYGVSKLQLARKIGGILVTSVGALIVALWVNAAPPLPDGAEIEWMTDYQAARELAEAEGRPLLVDFGANWCQACQELERNTFSDRRIVEEGQRFVPVRVDLSPGPEVARGRELLAQYNQRGLPLVVMHDSHGGEAARVTSFIEAEQMLTLMQDVD
ncbi:MAG: protein-disulfide reductase DsbD family protein [Sandaracinaceae bacterium]